MNRAIAAATIRRWWFFLLVFGVVFSSLYAEIMPAARAQEIGVPTEPQFDTSPLIQEVIRKVRESMPELEDHEILVPEADIELDQGWAFGIAVVKPLADEEEPDLILFLAQALPASSWAVELEGAQGFVESVPQVPETILAPNEKDNLGVDVSAAGDGSANLSLPWATGATWIMTGGPHNNAGCSSWVNNICQDYTRPWSSLDFQGPGGVGQARAAADGTVYRSDECPNYIQINHANGWQTGYYHLTNESVSNEQTVSRGALLGDISAQAGCGGSADGPHVHFSLRLNNDKVEINNRDIGGWTVHEDSTQYTGNMTRISDAMVVYQWGGVHNDGTIGSGGGPTPTNTAIPPTPTPTPTYVPTPGPGTGPAFSDNFNRANGPVGNGWLSWWNGDHDPSANLLNGELRTYGYPELAGGVSRNLLITFPVRFSFDYRTANSVNQCGDTQYNDGGWRVIFNSADSYTPYSAVAQVKFEQYAGSRNLIRRYITSPSATYQGDMAQDAAPIVGGQRDFGPSRAHIDGVIFQDLGAVITIHYNDGQSPDPVVISMGPAPGAIDYQPGPLLMLANSNCSSGPHYFDNFQIGPYTNLTKTFASGGSQDGWVLESGETSSLGGTMDSTATTLRAGDNYQDRQYRSLLSFSTSSLPDNAVITSAQVKVCSAGVVGTNPFTTHQGLVADIRRPYFGSAVGLQTSDFQASSSLGRVGTFGTTPSGGCYTATLSSTAYQYVNRTGSTQFRLRFLKDDNDDLSNDYIKFYSSNYSDSSKRPVLIIKYYVP